MRDLLLTNFHSLMIYVPALFYWQATFMRGKKIEWHMAQIVRGLSLGILVNTMAITSLQGLTSVSIQSIVLACFLGITSAGLKY